MEQPGDDVNNSEQCKSLLDKSFVWAAKRLLVCP